MKSVAALAAVTMAVAVSCGGGGEPVPTISAPSSIRVTSGAFEDGGSIPVKYTCDGEDVSPPLAWTPADDPAGYVVVVTDVDAPGGGYVHWAVFGIPPDTASFPEGDVPAEATEVENDFGREGYGGPCPPEGDAAHRYVFTVYALDRLPDGELPDESAGDLVRAIECCVQARGTLDGTYGR